MRFSKSYSVGILYYYLDTDVQKNGRTCIRVTVLNQTSILEKQNHTFEKHQLFRKHIV